MEFTLRISLEEGSTYKDLRDVLQDIRQKLKSYRGRDEQLEDGDNSTLPGSYSWEIKPKPDGDAEDAELPILLEGGWTAEAARQYVTAGGPSCPRCDSGDITARMSSPIIENGIMTQEITCPECGLEWLDEYTLTAIRPTGNPVVPDQREPDEPPTPEPEAIKGDGFTDPAEEERAEEEAADRAAEHDCTKCNGIDPTIAAKHFLDYGDDSGHGAESECELCVFHTRHG